MNPKELVKQIQKLAQNPPARYQAHLAGKSPEPKAENGVAIPRLGDQGATPVSTNTTTQSSASKDSIRKMQELLIDISKTVNEKVNVMHGQEDFARNPNAAERGKAKDAFNNFFVQNYMQQKDNGKTRASNFGTDPTITDPKKKKTSETGAWRMSNIMNTVSRIGSAIKESREDGIWAFRTQTSLRDVTIFTQCILEMLMDFGMNDTTYSEADLKALQGFVAQYDALPRIPNTPSQEKRVPQSLVQAVIKNITPLHTLYQKFYAKTIDNPFFADFIDGSAAFAEYGKTSEDPHQLDEQEQNALKESATSSVPSDDQRIKRQHAEINLQNCKAMMEKAVWHANQINNTAGLTAEEMNRRTEPYRQQYEKASSQMKGYQAQLDQLTYEEGEKQTKLTFSPPIKTSFKAMNEDGAPSNIQISSIPLSALQDQNAFQSWAKQYAEYGGNTPQVMAQLLSAIQAKLDQQPTKYVSSPGKAKPQVASGPTNTPKGWSSPLSSETVSSQNSQTQ